MFGPDQKKDGEVLEMELTGSEGAEEGGAGGGELEPPRLGGGRAGVAGRREGREKRVLSLG